MKQNLVLCLEVAAAILPRLAILMSGYWVEGLLLFVLLWWFSARPRPVAAVSGLFLLGYGVFRGAVELLRMPDAHLGYLAFGWVTMGQLLSLPMIVDGKTSAVPAMISSVRTVLDQPAVMLLWASVVALLTLVGFATFFIGLAIVFPILGYATWHSYRDCIDASAWPIQPPLPGANDSSQQSDSAAAV